MTDIGSYAVCLIFGRMSRSHRIRRYRVSPNQPTCHNHRCLCREKRRGGHVANLLLNPLEGLCASCHLPEGLVSWLGLPPWYGMLWYGGRPTMVWYGMVWYGMVWYGMVGVPTTSLGHRQHQSAEGEKRTIWLPTTCTDAHIVHNSFFAKLHHKRQKKR